MNNIKIFIKKNIWVWPAIGAFLLWLVMGVFSHNLNIESFLSNSYAASFLAIVTLGQMLVVTSGRGAIDLSIPGVITLMAFISMKFANGQNSNLFFAILIVLVIAVIIGILNSLMVLFLKIPAIIATMAMNYILTTLALLINKNFLIFDVAPALQGFIQNRFLGVQIIIYVIIGLGFLFVFILNKTPYGKSLHALGQNYDAAKLAGVKIIRVEMLTYIISSVMAALSGVLIAARVGGALLGMGDAYSMETVAAVAVGGTLISGGRASVVGSLVGCLFLALIVTAMQILGMPVGVQRMAKGAIILLVIVIGTFQQK